MKEVSKEFRIQNVLEAESKNRRPLETLSSSHANRPALRLAELRPVGVAVLLFFVLCCVAGLLVRGACYRLYCKFPAGFVAWFVFFCLSSK